MNILINRNIWEGDVKVELDLSSYTTKADLKKQSVLTQKIAKKTDLASLKLDVGNNNIVKKLCIIH